MDVKCSQVGLLATTLHSDLRGAAAAGGVILQCIVVELFR